MGAVAVPLRVEASLTKRRLWKHRRRSQKLRGGFKPAPENSIGLNSKDVAK